MSHIQPADPVARRKAVLLIGIGALLGGVLLWIFESGQLGLAEWVFDPSGHQEERLSWIIGALGVLSLPLFFGSFYLLRFGQSVIDAQRFPPPGVSVIRDTPVLSGEEAIFRGRLIRYASIFLCGCGFGFPLLFWWVLRVLVL